MQISVIVNIMLIITWAITFYFLHKTRKTAEHNAKIARELNIQLSKALELK